MEIASLKGEFISVFRKEYPLESHRDLLAFAKCKQLPSTPLFLCFTVLEKTLLPQGWERLGSSLAEAFWEWDGHCW